MTGTRATVALAAAGVAFAERVYRHDARQSDYGAEAAALLGVDPARVFKTLVTLVDDRVTVAIVPVAGRLDLRALATAVGGRRADLADPGVAERRTGYVVGGISPFGQRRPHPTVLDASATSHPTILVSGGRRGLDLELSPDDLIRLTRATVAPIAARPSVTG